MVEDSRFEQHFTHSIPGKLPRGPWLSPSKMKEKQTSWVCPLSDWAWCSCVQQCCIIHKRQANMTYARGKHFLRTDLLADFLISCVHPVRQYATSKSNECKHADSRFQQRFRPEHHTGSRWTGWISSMRVASDTVIHHKWTDSDVEWRHVMHFQVFGENHTTRQRYYPAMHCKQREISFSLSWWKPYRKKPDSMLSK